MSDAARVDIRSPLGARISGWILGAGAIGVVLAATPYKTFDLDRFFVPKELTLSVCALSLALLAIAGIRRVSLSRADEFLAGSLLLTFVSAMFATNHWIAQRSFAIALGGVVCFWCARRVAREGDDRGGLVSLLALAGVLAAATALLQAYGLHSALFSLNRAPGGTFGNRNFMSHLGAIALPAVILAGVRARTNAKFGLWCVGAGMVGAALMLSRTRAAWLALIAAFVVLCIASAIALRKRDDTLRVLRAALLILAIALGPLVSLILPNTLDWRSESPYQDTARGLVNYKGGSGKGRLVQYTNSLKMSLHHPLLGVGPGNWAVMYPRFASENDPSLTQDGLTANPWPSSDWVAFVSERGFAAAALLGLAVLALFANGVEALFRDTTSESRLVSAVFLATLTAVMIVGLFDAVLLLAAPSLIAWSLMGALAPAAKARRVVALGAVQRMAVGALILVVGAAAAVRSGAGIGAMSIYDAAPKLSVLERAATLDPGSYRIQLKLADGYERRGDCRKAKFHAAAAKSLLPYSPAAKRVVAACGT